MLMPAKHALSLSSDSTFGLAPVFLFILPALFPAGLLPLKSNDTDPLLHSSNQPLRISLHQLSRNFPLASKGSTPCHWCGDSLIEAGGTFCRSRPTSSRAGFSDCASDLVLGFWSSTLSSFLDSFWGCRRFTWEGGGLFTRRLFRVWFGIKIWRNECGRIGRDQIFTEASEWSCLVASLRSFRRECLTSGKPDSSLPHYLHPDRVIVTRTLETTLSLSFSFLLHVRLGCSCSTVALRMLFLYVRST